MHICHIAAIAPGTPIPTPSPIAIFSLEVNPPPPPPGPDDSVKLVVDDSASWQNKEGIIHTSGQIIATRSVTC